MGHIGNTVQTAFTSFDKQTITGTGTSVYTLSHSVANEQEIEVFVNNVRQEGGSGKAFTVSGNQITFTENIASTDTVYVNFQGKAVQTVSHPSDTPLQATTGTFSGDLTVDTNTLYVDSTNNRVGVGTASPSASLDVDGTIKLDGNHPVGTDNVALGDTALDSNVSGGSNTAIGADALTANTASNNTAVGQEAGTLATGENNTFIGQGSGGLITTGAKNTILGRYNGNQDGLDIRTSSNNIVLSDGDGDPIVIVNSNKEVLLGNTSTISNHYAAISGDPVHTIGNPNRSGLTSSMLARVAIQERQSKWISFVNGTPVHYGTIAISGSGVSYGSNSDYRLKENVVDLTGATARLKQLSPKRFNFIADPDNTTDGFLAHEVQSVVPDAVTGEYNGINRLGNVVDANNTVIKSNVDSTIELEAGQTFVEVSTEPAYQQVDPAKLVPLLVATIQELEARITALENA